MQPNDNTLEQYLYENRISPTPEFSARIDAFCAQLAKRERARNNTGRTSQDNRNRTNRMPRWLIPLAATFAVLVIVFSIPGVSQAVGNWLSSIFRLSDYMAVETDQRETNSDLAGAVQTPIPAQSCAAIQYVDETEYAESVNQWRTENGFSAFDRSNYAWVADLNPQVNELLYDGRNLIVNTVLFASPTRFLGTYGGEDERFDLWTNSVRVLVNGEPYTNFTSQGGGLSLQSYLKTGGNGEYDMDAVRVATSVTEQTTLIGNRSPAFPSGPVTVVIEMWLMDGSIDDLATVGLVAIITQTFTFDATDGNAKLDADYSVTQELADTAPLTINNKDGSIENRLFDFSSVTVGFTVERRATGINVTLHYSFPNDEDQSLWNAIVPGATGGQGVQYEAFVNGTSIGKVYHTANHLGLRDDPVIEIPLTESELAAVQSITLRPWVRYLSSYSIDGETFTDMPLDTKLTMSQFSDHYTEVALEDCDIVIPLK